jgi:putative transposase
MDDYDNIRSARHRSFVRHAHWVFVTKYRHRVFSDLHLARIEVITRAVRKDFEAEPVAPNSETNHAHLVVSFPPKRALSRLVNSLKRVSSRRPRQEFPDPVRHYWHAKCPWSGSYFAASVSGAPINVLRQ